MIKAMKDFQIPMRIEVDKETLSPTYGKFSAEAFERGFGTTIGNSLRRVLLSCERCCANKGPCGSRSGAWSSIAHCTAKAPASLLP